ncbi:hypothetical protein [Amycolatopsis sp. NPDC098790]|uniref:hypothetical protein n=1 Tax=Amycolatopsis sp. NPDC098790 TaxID=3363939 RepID=UPI00382D4505
MALSVVKIAGSATWPRIPSRTAPLSRAMMTRVMTGELGKHDRTAAATLHKVLAAV